MLGPREPGTPCRQTRPTTRIGEVATRRLVEKSSRERASEASDSDRDRDADDPPTAVRAGADDGVVLALDGAEHRLSRAAARALRDGLADAVSGRTEFLHTAGEHRADGSYAVERRAAESAGHVKVFERFEALERLYDRLPRTFTAEDVGGPGLTGGRRHVVLRHVAEHPRFDCELVSRQPLTVRKRADGSDGGRGDRGPDAGGG